MSFPVGVSLGNGGFPALQWIEEGSRKKYGRVRYNERWWQALVLDAWRERSWPPLPCYRYDTDQFLVTGVVQVPSGEMLMAPPGAADPDLMVHGERRVAIEVKTNDRANVEQLVRYQATHPCDEMLLLVSRGDPNPEALRDIGVPIILLENLAAWLDTGDCLGRRNGALGAGLPTIAQRLQSAIDDVQEEVRWFAGRTATLANWAREPERLEKLRIDYFTKGTTDPLVSRDLRASAR